ncbi:MAG: hypothetical protein ACREQM_18465, partial [Candidatus Dormibacteraceae bacterium]
GTPSSMGQAKTIGRVRIAADATQRWLAILGAALCAIQVALAGLGFWGAAGAGMNQAAEKAAFAPHALNGQVLEWLAVVLLAAGIVARANRKAWIIPLLLGILLWVVQGLLVGLGFGVSQLFGALHALDGTLIAAGFVWLAYDRWQHRLGSAR